MSAGLLWCLPGITGRTPWADVWQRQGWRLQRHARRGECRLLDPAGGLIAEGDEAALLAQGRSAAPPPASPRAVLILHGLGRLSRMMQPMAAAVEAAGFMALTPTYASLTCGFADHVAQMRLLLTRAAEDGVTECHYIGHSLGGLIIRALMAEDATPQTRAVLIGSPNQGALLAQRLTGLPLWRPVIGPVGESLLPDHRLKIPVPLHGQLAVIAGGNGRRGWNPLLPGDDDGIVRTVETRLPGREAAFMTVRALHTSLPLRRDVIAASVSFLTTGQFSAEG